MEGSRSKDPALPAEDCGLRRRHGVSSRPSTAKLSAAEVIAVGDWPAAGDDPRRPRFRGSESERPQRKLHAGGNARRVRSPPTLVSAYLAVLALPAAVREASRDPIPEIPRDRSILPVLHRLAAFRR